MEFQGWVALLVAVLLLGYAIPEVVARRQTVADSRAEDRFSESMRIVARAGDSRAHTARKSTDDDADRQPHESHPGITSASTPLLSRPREVAMKSTTGSSRFPIAYRARVLAHARSQRAAAVSRRQAGGRRLAFLIVAILAVTVGAWVAVSRVGVPIASAIVPTVVAAGLLALIVKGRINVVARNRTDREKIRRIDTELRALARGDTVENPVSDEIITGGTARQTTDTDDDADHHARAHPGQANKPARGGREAAAKATGTTGGRGPGGGGPGGGRRPDTSDAPADRRDEAYNLEAEFTDAEWASPDADPVTVPGEVVAEADDDAGDVPFDAERYWDDEDHEPHRDDTDHPAAPGERAGDDGRGWTPQRVPAPSWAMQPDVPRRHTASYEADEAPRSQVPARPTVAVARPGMAKGPEEEGSGVEEPPEDLEPTIDLEEVLARRRGA